MSRRHKLWLVEASGRPSWPQASTVVGVAVGAVAAWAGLQAPVGSICSPCPAQGQDRFIRRDAANAVAVMGPSGSGESTLLTIAGSLEDPTGGEVLVCGMALAGMPRAARPGCGAG